VLEMRQLLREIIPNLRSVGSRMYHIPYTLELFEKLSKTEYKFP
jgi:hypothetical protein